MAAREACGQRHRRLRANIPALTSSAQQHLELAATSNELEPAHPIFDARKAMTWLVGNSNTAARCLTQSLFRLWRLVGASGSFAEGSGRSLKPHQKPKSAFHPVFPIQRRRRDLIKVLLSSLSYSITNFYSSHEQYKIVLLEYSTADCYTSAWTEAPPIAPSRLHQGSRSSSSL
ncbi:hypothetical protein GALMADRAFT_883874 [Galerina marginata CBS 339.88]|uniref:Uncharacterized protein n=1 Tax=Galerina marginata (strain CBS 339.88) TaxID=685588 RepID=A0A067SHJ5_GALM3|nr:hypothetical protein GALMADRAFT_883874 [Galerina marginata CBS 339.88]